MSVVDLQSERKKRAPHVAGSARCLDCRHEWAAVAPIDGALWLECPNCSLHRGRFLYAIERNGPHWNCACGCDLFYVTRDGYYCPNCGQWQPSHSLPPTEI